VGNERHSVGVGLWATARRTASKRSGNLLPRFSARRRIPAAALGLKKYLGATCSSRTSGKDEDTPPPLGYSEEPGVKNTPGEVMKPEVGQTPEDGSEVPSGMRTEQTWDVLNKNESSGPNKLACDSGELEEEGGAGTFESGAPAGDGEVLTGESAAEEIKTAG
jgi:hypothetical protein